MKRIVFIIFIFCWNLAISQNNNVFVVNKSTATVFKFKLPAEIILTLNGRYKIVKDKKEFHRFDVVLLKVSNDSLFIQSVDKKLQRVLIWDSVETIKFLKPNATTSAITPFMLIAGVTTVALPLMAHSFAIMVYPFCFLFAPIAIIKWTHSRREFEAKEYYILN